MLEVRIVGAYGDFDWEGAQGNLLRWALELLCILIWAMVTYELHLSRHVYVHQVDIEDLCTLP